MLPGTARQISQGSEFLFNSLLTISPDMVFRLSQDGTILDFNPTTNIDPPMSAKDLIGTPTT